MCIDVCEYMMYATLACLIIMFVFEDHNGQ